MTSLFQSANLQLSGLKMKYGQSILGVTDRTLYYTTMNETKTLVKSSRFKVLHYLVTTWPQVITAQK